MQDLRLFQRNEQVCHLKQHPENDQKAVERAFSCKKKLLKKWRTPDDIK